MSGSLIVNLHEDVTAENLSTGDQFQIITFGEDLEVDGNFDEAVIINGNAYGHNFVVITDKTDGGVWLRVSTPSGDGEGQGGDGNGNDYLAPIFEITEPDNEDENYFPVQGSVPHHTAFRAAYTPDVAVQQRHQSCTSTCVPNGALR